MKLITKFQSDRHSELNKSVKTNFHWIIVTSIIEENRKHQTNKPEKKNLANEPLQIDQPSNKKKTCPESIVKSLLMFTDTAAKNKRFLFYGVTHAVDIMTAITTACHTQSGNFGQQGPEQSAGDRITFNPSPLPYLFSSPPHCCHSHVDTRWQGALRTIFILRRPIFRLRQVQKWTL